MITFTRNFRLYSIVFLFLFSLLLFSFSLLASNEIREVTHMKDIINESIGEGGLAGVISLLSGALIWLERRFSSYRKEQKQALEKEVNFYRKELEKEKDESKRLNDLLQKQNNQHNQELKKFYEDQTKRLQDDHAKQIKAYNTNISEFTKLLKSFNQNNTKDGG